MFRKKQTSLTYRSYRTRTLAARTRVSRTHRLHVSAVTLIAVSVVLASGGIFGVAALQHVDLPMHPQAVRTTSPRLTPVSAPAPMQALTPSTPRTQAVASAPTPASPKSTQAASISQSAPCSNNQESQLVLVSISQQHMWACSGSQLAYETSVTTGAYEISGDATPTGTWHIFDKETNLYLTGPGYKDFVQYWMPFYSDYGFHDASWQTFSFGGSEYSTQGSHGCVHLPTSAASWLYNWAPIGTTVTIEA